MTRVLTGPARCVECRAVWRALHLASIEEGCIRCGGRLELEEPRQLGPRFPAIDALPPAGAADPHARHWGWTHGSGPYEPAA